MKRGSRPPNIDEPSTAPDYDFWVAMPSWTREEAIALLTGHDPANPNHSKRSNQEQEKLALLIDRAFSFGVFPNAIQVSPSDCVSIAASSNLPLRGELLKAFRDKKIDLKNWKSECKQLAAENVRLAKAASESSAPASAKNETVTGLKRKLSSLQVALLGVAIDKFNMKKDWQNTSVAKNIASSIERSGLTLNEDTVRKHLGAAVEAKGGKARFNT